MAGCASERAIVRANNGSSCDRWGSVTTGETVEAGGREGRAGKSRQRGRGSDREGNTCRFLGVLGGVGRGSGGIGQKGMASTARSAAAKYERVQRGGGGSWVRAAGARRAGICTRWVFLFSTLASLLSLLSLIYSLFYSLHFSLYIFLSTFFSPLLYSLYTLLFSNIPLHSSIRYTMPFCSLNVSHARFNVTNTLSHTIWSSVPMLRNLSGWIALITRM